MHRRSCDVSFARGGVEEVRSSKLKADIKPCDVKPKNQAAIKMKRGEQYAVKARPP
jgi:hypothetical protein